MKMRKLIGCAVLLYILLPHRLEAQPSVLFVGNSYTYFNDMPQMVGKLADVNHKVLNINTSVDGGVSLKEHWEEYRGLKSKSLVAAGDFDFVVLQDQSLTPIHSPDNTLKYGKLLGQLVKDQGGQPIVYQTWSRKHNPETQAQLDATFGQLANGTGALIAKVADAWHLAFEEYPELELYDPDGSHPSALGSYLAALIIYRTLFDVTMAGEYNTFVSDQMLVSEMKKCEWVADQIMKD